MINMRRISKNSNIALLTIEEFEEYSKQLFLKVIQSDTIKAFSRMIHNLLQICTDEKYAIIEWLDVEDIQELEDNTTPFDAQPQKTQAQMDLETALDTMLINDPLGKYNNCNLRVPFDKKDNEWIEWVLKNMHNKFIRDKVQLIKDSGYGK